MELVGFITSGASPWSRYDADARSVMTLNDTNAVVEDAWSVPRTFFTHDL